MRELAFPILVVIVVVIAIYSIVKGRINRGKAENGEDMERLKNAVAQVLPNETGYTVACAHWERSEYYGRRTTTYYYSYALAFDAQRLWIIPLRFEKDEIFPQNPVLITKDNVGVATVDTTMKKDALSRVTVTLSDKQGESPINFYVDALNTRDSRFYHFNIAQQAECERFEQFISSMAGVVNEENKGLQEELKAKSLASTAKSSRTMGILSIVFSIFPLLGLVFGIIGIIAAPKPKETGGKPVAGFILCAVGLGLSIVLTAAWILVMIIS